MVLKQESLAEFTYLNSSGNEWQETYSKRDGENYFI